MLRTAAISGSHSDPVEPDADPYREGSCPFGQPSAHDLGDIQLILIGEHDALTIAGDLPAEDVGHDSSCVRVPDNGYSLLRDILS